MIKAFLTGIGITFFGGVLFFILINFYSDLDGHNMTGLEICLSFLMMAALFPMVAAKPFVSDQPGDWNIAVALVITAFVWGLAILFFWHVKKLIKEGRQTPK